MVMAGLTCVPALILNAPKVCSPTQSQIQINLTMTHTRLQPHTLHCKLGLEPQTLVFNNVGLRNENILTTNFAPKVLTKYKQKKYCHSTRICPKSICSPGWDFFTSKNRVKGVSSCSYLTQTQVRCPNPHFKPHCHMK